jgi:hypothetical protein
MTEPSEKNAGVLSAAWNRSIAMKGDPAMDRKMWLSIGFAIGVASLLIVGSAQASMINVPDASFEDPVVPAGDGYHYCPAGPWTGQRSMVLNPPEYNAAWGDHILAAKDGDQIGVLNGSSDYTWMTQDLADTYQAGGNYTLSVSMASGNKAGPMLDPSNLTMMLGYWTGDTDPTFIGRAYHYPTIVAQRIVQWNEVSGTSWADFSFSTGAIAADSPAVGKPITIWFGDEDTGWPMPNYYDSGIWCLDSVQLSAIPEPSTIALALSGAFVLVACAWRKWK